MVRGWMRKRQSDLIPNYRAGAPDYLLEATDVFIKLSIPAMPRSKNGKSPYETKQP